MVIKCLGKSKVFDTTTKFYYLSTVPSSASLMKFPSSRSSAKPLQLKQKSLVINQLTALLTLNSRNNN